MFDAVYLGDTIIPGTYSMRSAPAEAAKMADRSSKHAISNNTSAGVGVSVMIQLDIEDSMGCKRERGEKKTNGKREIEDRRSAAERVFALSYCSVSHSHTLPFGCM